MAKPLLPETIIRRCIINQLGTPAINLQPLTEGLESQAFEFLANGNQYVIRINPSLDSFKKDRYAAQHYDGIPIPQIYQLGMIDNTRAFCISQKAPGFSLQAADQPTIKRLLEPTLAIWNMLSTIDIAQTSGFGYVAPTGNAAYTTWQDYILSMSNPTVYNWQTVIDSTNQSIINAIFAALNSLIPWLPEQRTLIHGDFGSNNVLTDGTQITAVLDWDATMYGDPLFDIATAYFWSPWLDCMQIFADFCEQRLSVLANYRERIRCYQLLICLREIDENSTENNITMMNWCIERGISIINEE